MPTKRAGLLQGLFFLTTAALLFSNSNAQTLFSYGSHAVDRAEFLKGRSQIHDFLVRKWKKELDYRLCKELWAFGSHRIAVRFAYEWHDADGQWFRSYGNENWEFDSNGLMQVRIASINDGAILPEERRFNWDLGRRPDAHPGLTAMGL